MKRSGAACPTATVICLLALVASGCSSDRRPQPPARTTTSGAAAMSFHLTSTAFANGDEIPRKYTGEGDDVSPPLAWSGAPQGAQGFVLICDDPDAPTPEPWVHWLIYGIAADAQSLPEGVPAGRTELDKPVSARQGKNSWVSGVTIGYRGPLPPPGHGTHHYHFQLYALNNALEVPPSATKGELLEAIRDHVLAQTELVGTYAR